MVVLAVVIIIVQFVVVVAVGWLVFVEVVLIKGVLLMLSQGVVLCLRIVIDLLLWVLMALFWVVEVFLSVDISLGVRGGGRVMLPVLLVGAISGTGNVREGVLRMGSSTVRSWVMELSIMRSWVMLLTISYWMMKLTVRASVTMVLWGLMRWMMFHKISLRTGMREMDRVGCWGSRWVSRWMSWLVGWASPVTMSRSCSSGSVDWMMLTGMTVHVSAIAILRLITRSCCWSARRSLPFHLRDRCSSLWSLTLSAGLWWRAHLWPCPWCSPILWRCRRCRRRWRWCWKRWLCCLRRSMASWLGWSRTRLSLLLIPIVWQVEMHIDISAVKVVVSTQRESYILAHLPAHIIPIEVTLLIWVGEIVSDRL